MKARRLVLASLAALSSVGLGQGAAASVSVPGRASSPAGTSGTVAPGVQSGSDTITMLSQPAWVETSGVYRLELQIDASAASSEQLVVQGYSRLSTRTSFDDALAGRYDTGVAYAPTPIPLGSLPSDPDGGVDVNIPVNQAGTANGLPEFNAVAGSGVFPLEIYLANPSGNQVGQPLTTFLVYAAGSSAVTSLPPLSVAVVLPVHAAPAVDKSGSLAPLPDNASSELAAITSTLASYSNVPISLAVTPETLDALGLGSATDTSTLKELSDLARAGSDQVLPATYVNVSASGMVASGLADELGLQVQAGSTALAGGLDVAPPSGTWVVDAPLDPATLGVLVANGARRLVVPADELSALPAGYQQFTFASPSQLAEPNVAVPVYGADALLTADFDNSGGPVLAASQLLAELAMIQLETPGIVRGVTVLPPQGWNVDPTFVRTLLAGLAGHPLLKAVTVNHLFSAVPAAPVARSLVAPAPVTPSTVAANGASTAPPTTTPTTLASIPLGSTDVAAIRSARLKLNEVTGILGPNSTDSTRVAGFDRQLLTAESVDIGETQRRNLVQSVRNQSARILGQISLPNASITLTSTRGQIPLTILANPSLRARVQLRLSSTRLIFRSFTAGSGTCLASQPTNLTCSLVLAAQNTTIKIPVEARSSGVFPLTVTLLTANGSMAILTDKDTVRSTAVSGVGIILIVLAVLSLAVWWGRDLHHGRRARRLVPAPPDETTTGGSEAPEASEPERLPIPAETARVSVTATSSPGGAPNPNPPPESPAPAPDRPRRAHRSAPSRGNRPPHPPA